MLIPTDLKVIYHDPSDTLYLNLRPQAEVVSQVEMESGMIFVDVDRDMNAVGIEVLFASHVPCVALLNTLEHFGYVLVDYVLQ